MKNILRIVRHDLKKITGSVVAIITIMGLCLVPCCYAWFNILSNWAPYEAEATGRISVAVANMDKGASAAGITINVGEKIEEALEANDSIGWVFTESDEEAIEGVHSGDYYAALVIPEDFSNGVLSFVNGKLENPKLKYYENEKKNAVAPKITGKAKTAVQEEVNAAFVETLARYVSDAASVAEASGIDPQQMLADLADRIDDISGDLTSCIALADSAAGLTDASGNLIKVSDEFIGSTHDVFKANDKLLADAEKELAKIKKADTKELNAAIQDIKDTAASLKTFKTVGVELLSASDLAYDTFLKVNRDNWVTRVNKLKSQADDQAKYLKKKDFTALSEKFTELSSTLSDISKGLEQLEEGMDYSEREPIIKKIREDTDKAIKLTDEILGQIRTDIDENLETALVNARSSLSGFRKTMSGADKGLSSLSNLLGSFDGALSRLKASIGQTSSSLEALQDGSGSLSELLMEASGNDLLEELNNLMANDQAAVAEYLANPVQMDKKVFWPIESYGSAMAPFYTVLAQWVGALLTAVLIKVRLRKKREFGDLRLHEWYFGRLGLYLLVGIAQALVVSAGDLLYVRIQCLSPLRFVLVACINSIVFMMINYALVFALDNIGLGASVIILVLQVAGSGGTYPVEVLPGIFRTLFPFMPFRYAMDAMRECIGGMYGNTYWKCLGILLLFAVGSVAFGLLLYKPAKKINEAIAVSKAKSEIML
ncbi:MAG: YhgE/Pip domain-containing protein [Mogibacterium sp.]|nr:YhgE/Pip domain-containing protein [Mogibacterium sp.]